MTTKRLLGILFASVATVFSAIVMGYFSFVNWQSDRQQHLLAHGTLETSDITLLPFNSRLAHDGARRSIYNFSSENTRTADLLDHAVRYSPLDATIWIDLAELAINQGRFNDAAVAAKTAVRLWPTRAPVQWRASSLFSQLGLTTDALEAIRSYLIARPSKAKEALILAQHLVQDQSELLERLRPSFTNSNSDPVEDVYSERMLIAARQLNKNELVDRAWETLPEAYTSAHENVFKQIDYLVNQRRFDRAKALWSELFEKPGNNNLVTNGGFETELLNGGFGWHSKTTNNYKIERDNKIAFSQSHSLRIDYLGEKNEWITVPYQLLNVYPNQTIKVSGRWRGKDISTRPGVYIDVTELYTGKNRSHSTKPKRGSWGWERFELSLVTQPQTRVATLRLLRAKTTNFDNKTTGRVWLDDIMVTTLGPRSHGSDAH